MRADSADMGHLPRPRFVAIGVGGERTHRANVDAHATLFAIQLVLIVGSDDGTGIAKLNAQRGDIHPFTADAYAAIAENAAWTIEEDNRGPLLLVAMVLDFDELGAAGPVFE